MNTNTTQIEQFKQYLINCSKSENTITSYIAEINHYFTLYDTLSRQNIIEYKIKLSESLEPKSINHRLTSLKMYNEYLLSQNLIDRIYIIKEDYTKIQDQGNPTDITNEQAEKFLKRVATKEHIYKSRNIAIVYLIANTGIRREECCEILLKNIDLDNSELRLIGKGNKQRVVILTESAIKVIKDYLVDRNNNKNKDSKYLFLSERGEKLSPKAINDIFSYYSTPKCKITPHKLRHNFATVTIEEDIFTLPELQNQLGHSNINTTGIYAKARKESIKKKINKLNIGMCL